MNKYKYFNKLKVSVSILTILSFILMGLLPLSYANATSYDTTSIKPNYQTSGNRGAFSTGAPISVPSFHGLEPKFSLGYSSGGGNGFAGAGWGLGFGTISRVSSDSGIPKWDSTDIFMLGGQKLRACSGSESPSCSAGGNYWTEYENYKKIYYNSTNNDWTVYEQNGTKSTYELVMGWTSKDYMWGLDEVEDINGNTVEYNWWCDTDSTSMKIACYPNTIVYNGTTITIYRETRPDPITFATGATLGYSKYRPKTIDVQTSSNRVRAYKLTYSTSTPSSRSLLSSVQMYGKDATIVSGSITGGTSLPATSFTYRNDTSYDEFNGSTQTTAFCDISLPGNTKTGTGDFDGDGLTDIYCFHDGYTQIAYSDGDGTFTLGSEFSHGCANNKDLVVADFNNDGLQDFLCQGTTVGSKPYVSLNQGGDSFGSFTDWGGTCDFSQDHVQWGIADANGDGKTDWWCHNGRNPISEDINPIDVGISDGTQFTESVWIEEYCPPAGGTFIMGPDLNGDNKADAICQGDASGFIWSKLSTGSGFVDGFSTLTFWCGGAAYGNRFGTGDFNGDGKSDLWCHVVNSPWTYNIAYSTGNDWKDYRQSMSYCGGATDMLSTGDFNGDGRTDLYCHDEADENYVYLSKDEGTFTTKTSWKDDWCDLQDDGNLSLHAGDFNGDGKTDLACTQREANSGKIWVTHAGATRGKADLISKVENGLGGSAEITYTPSTDWVNTNRIPTTETVKDITMKDGRGWDSKTEYEYSGGYIDVDAKKYLGFREVKTKLPKITGESANPYTKTYYRQIINSPGAFDYSLSYNSSGQLLGASSVSYTFSGDGKTTPYKAQASEQWSYVYEPGSSCSSWPCTYGERYQTKYEIYNSYGHPTIIKNYGNNDVSGDETTTSITYVPANTTKYIVNLKGKTATYSGIGTGGTKLKEREGRYDGATTWNSTPTKGQLTKSLNWNDSDASWVGSCTTTSCVTYDSYGNVTEVEHPLDSTKDTTTVFDSTYHKFPTSVTNPLGHETTYAYNTEGIVCERPTTTTDPNSQSETRDFDALCRLSRADGPTGTNWFIEKIYNDFGTVSTQNVETQEPSADGDGDQWTKSYFDGLGRIYRNKSKGTAIIISEEKTFDDRGNVRTASLPRYAGTGGLTYDTTYDYDSLNRVIKATYPDSEYSTVAYNLRKTTSTDPEGKITVGERSADGRTQYLKQSLGSVAVILPVEPIVLWDPAGGDIPTGWSCISCQSGDPFYQKFPRGAATYGSQGGNATHSHSVSVSAAGVSSSPQVSLYKGDQFKSLAYSTHTHGGGVTTSSNANNLPSYRNLKVIKSDSATTILPYQSIVLLDSATMPNGDFTRYTDQDGYFIRGEGSSSTGGNAVHNHTFSVTSGAGSTSGNRASNPSCASNWGNHTHVVSGTTPIANREPQYAKIVLAEVTDEGGTELPVGILAMFENAPPSSEWTIRSGAGGTLNGDFLKGNATADFSTFGSDTHTHTSMNVTSQTAPRTDARSLNCANSGMYDRHYHTHLFPTSFGGTVDHKPPYTDVIIAKKTTATTIVPASTITTTKILDVLGRTTAVEDDDGNDWTWDINSLGWVEEQTDPDSDTTTNEHDDMGRITETTDALNQVTKFYYDLISRPTKTTYLYDTGGVFDVENTYDQVRSGYYNKGHLTEMDGVDGDETYDYDKIGRPVRSIKTVDSTDYTFVKGYDAGGRVTSVTYPDSDAFTITYDAAGRLKTISNIVSNTVYNAAGQPTIVTYANGVVETNTYSAQRGWLTNLDTMKDTTTIQDLDYTRNDTGVITAITSDFASESWTFTYDDLYRLIEADNTDTSGLDRTYMYDDINNITYKSDVGSYTYGTKPHAVTSAGGNSYVYNAVGQMTSGAGRTIDWNGMGLPASISYGSTNEIYTYDGFGSRVKRDVDGQVTEYIGSDYEIAPDSTITKYLGPAKKVDDTLYWMHTDHLGSLQVVTNSSGAEVNRQKYAPFGQEVSDEGTESSSVGYIGEKLDDETGLQYLNARYYDPVLGRFISADPIMDGLNAYTYSDNNPVNFSDPSGLEYGPGTPWDPNSAMGTPCPGIQISGVCITWEVIGAGIKAFFGTPACIAAGNCQGMSDWEYSNLQDNRCLNGVGIKGCEEGEWHGDDEPEPVVEPPGTGGELVVSFTQIVGPVVIDTDQDDKGYSIIEYPTRYWEGPNEHDVASRIVHEWSPDFAWEVVEPIEQEIIESFHFMQRYPVLFLLGPTSRAIGAGSKIGLAILRGGSMPANRQLILRGSSMARNLQLQLWKPPPGPAVKLMPKGWHKKLPPGPRIGPTSQARNVQMELYKGWNYRRPAMRQDLQLELGQGEILFSPRAWSTAWKTKIK